MSETAKRILSAIVTLPIYVYTFASDGFNFIPILICSLLVSLACLYEFYMICDKGDGQRPFMAWGMALGVIINIIMYVFAFGKIYGYTAYIPSFDARIIMAVVSIVITALFVIQILKMPITGAIYSLSVTIFGIMFIVFSFSHIILMKALRDGFYYILILNIVVMINDSAAYFGGRMFGKHKASFKVSPNKSWEGYFFGLLFSILAMIITSQVFEIFFGKNLFNMIEATLLGVALCITGNIGDLAESAVKRDGAIKDSGSIIPGHGGMWDVFDAMIVSLPFFYYYLVLKGVQ